MANAEGVSAMRVHISPMATPQPRVQQRNPRMALGEKDRLCNRGEHDLDTRRKPRCPSQSRPTLPFHGAT